MNIETGKLYESLSEALLHEEKSDKLKEVPKKLKPLAQKELAGQKTVTIDLKKDTPLTRWANGVNARPKKNKRRIRRKIANTSRKRNRK